MSETRQPSAGRTAAKVPATHGYGSTRRADPAILRAVARAVGGAPSVLNIGAGTGSYEPPSRRVVAIEPSDTLIAQRKSDAAPVVKAVAEDLPFKENSFAAAMAILTLPHWSDPLAGLREMRRVARRRAVVLTIDPSKVGGYWAYRYFPTAEALDRDRFPSIDDAIDALGGEARVDVVPIAHNCRDSFLGAYWRRPSLILDARTRRTIATLSEIGDDDLLDGLADLASDIRSGRWEMGNAWLLDLPELDLGYRLITAEYA